MDEGVTGARMMSVVLHLRIIGRPARIGGLEALLDRMSASGEVWFATRAQIAERWREAAGLPAWAPKGAAA